LDSTPGELIEADPSREGQLYALLGGEELGWVDLGHFSAHFLAQWSSLPDDQFQANIKWLARAAVLVQDQGLGY